MLVRKIWSSKDKPHDEDDELRHWRIAKAGQQFSFAEPHGGTRETLYRFRDDQNVVRRLFRAAAQTKYRWTEEDYETVATIVKRWGYLR